MSQRYYIAIDLKSFYASVECVDRHLDPLLTNLVVADQSRTEKTICLAVSPSLKANGIPGRARLFEVIQKVREVNAQRRRSAPGFRFRGRSCNAVELQTNPGLELDFIVAKPRMARYMEISSKIYGIYLRHISPDDIHVYSVDEVFIDATQYLRMYGMTARELAMMLIRDVLEQTGITATVGIGTNLYLCKIAMDIVAKKMPPDKDGVRIAELDEACYRRQLWDHKPLTDFWRVGHGISDRLYDGGMFTMGDVARMSLVNEELLYRMFGVNAELLIDHAWGWEPCTIDAIKEYRPESNSLSVGQVLSSAYDFKKGRVVVQEMADSLVLDLVSKGLVTDQIVLTVDYDVENMQDNARRRAYHGDLVCDHYGRICPKSAHGSINLDGFSSSSKHIIDATGRLFDKIVNPILLVRRMYVVANHVIAEQKANKMQKPVQLELFTDYEAQEKKQQAEAKELEKEKKRQKAIISIRNQFGKNAILRGMNFEDGATARERNQQIGGHRA